MVAITSAESAKIRAGFLADAGWEVHGGSAPPTAEEILALEPDGVFLSNGPGDPAATGEYAVPTNFRAGFCFDRQGAEPRHLPSYGQQKCSGLASQPPRPRQMMRPVLGVSLYTSQIIPVVRT